jgi:hypothetical protein
MKKNDRDRIVKRTLLIIVSVMVIFGMLEVIQAHLDHRLYDLQIGKEKLMSEAITPIKTIISAN